MVYMGDKDIEVELIANNASMALSNASIASGGDVGERNVLSTSTYKIGDMIVYSRKLHIKGGMES